MREWEKKKENAFAKHGSELQYEEKPSHISCVSRNSISILASLCVCFVQRLSSSLDEC